MATKSAQNTPEPSTAKTVFVIISLILFWPLGLVLMLVWMKWPVWIKIVVPIGMAFVALIVTSFIATLLVAFINPQAKVQMARLQLCANQCESETDQNKCVTDCVAEFDLK